MIDSVQTISDLAKRVFGDESKANNYLEKELTKFDGQTLIDLASSGDSELLQAAVEHLNALDQGQF